MGATGSKEQIPYQELPANKVERLRRQSLPMVLGSLPCVVTLRHRRQCRHAPFGPERDISCRRCWLQALVVQAGETLPAEYSQPLTCRTCQCSFALPLTALVEKSIGQCWPWENKVPRRQFGHCPVCRRGNFYRIIHPENCVCRVCHLKGRTEFEYEDDPSESSSSEGRDRRRYRSWRERSEEKCCSPRL